MDGKAPRLEKEETDNHEKVEESSSSVIRRVRRSTGVGGKAPRLAINFKQVFLFNFQCFNQFQTGATQETQDKSFARGLRC